MKKNKRCAIYTRVSKTDNHTHLKFVSRKTQEEQVKSYIDSQDKFIYLKTYHDDGCKEANLNRPALKELLRDVQKEEIDILIIYRMDRLTREAEGLYNFLKYLAKKKVDFISIVDGFDTTLPEGKEVLERIPEIKKMFDETFTTGTSIYDD